ncbi:zinc-binding dehydrogenase [Micromonospora arborensis]|uniref:zinc-binding dehydrogenase n=1 Tax=Micromonospora arborensis TaxID=2116518 RepID=UPI00371B45D6
MGSSRLQADVGLLRVGMSVAMVAIFVVDLTVPQAWHDAPGALDAPLVFVCAYLVVRFVHLGVYSVAAGRDAGLHRQIAIAWIPVAANAPLHGLGAPAGGCPARYTVLIMRAVQCTRFGGPDVLDLVQVPEPVAGDGQLLVDVVAAGVNFADTSRIAGSYRPVPDLPFIPGTEVVGRTTDGRRVLAPIFGGGGFAERAVVEDADAVVVPDGVGDAEALALLVQGLTAWHLLKSCARMRCGETIVVNAAAGGVGSLAVQLAKHFGAGRVIATASTDARRDLVLSLGADVAVSSEAAGYAERVLDANDGMPVDIVLDSIGGRVFSAGLGILANFGRLITFGNASREGNPPVDPGALADRNTAVMGFWLRPALTVPGTYAEPLAEMFALTAAGVLQPVVDAAYPLADARRAFDDVIARRTTGKVTLRP